MTARRFQHALTVAGLGGLLVLAGCDAPDPEADDVAPPQARSAMVTGAFLSSGRAENLVFLPNSQSPWTGYIAASLSGGGFELFNVDGVSMITAEGPRLYGMTGVAEFALRGENFPMLFGVDELGQLRGFVVVRETREVIELPLEADTPLPVAAGLCLYDEAIGYLELALLDEDAQARIVRIQDTGAAGLTVTVQSERDLPFPARSCAASPEGLLVAGPTAGLARVDEQGDALAFAQGLSVSDVSYTELLGRPTAMVASVQTGLLSLYDARTLSPITDVVFESGLSAPAFERPSALAVTEANYGGMAFASGLIAVYDEDDSRIKLVAREVLSRTIMDDAAP